MHTGHARTHAGMPFLCATHVVCRGGESPLRAVMSGTVRLSKGAGREAGSEGSDGGEASVTGVQTRRTGTGYKADATWAIGQWTEMPHSHPDDATVNPAGPGPGTQRLTVGGLHARLQRLSAGQPAERGMEKSAEAVVAAATKRRGSTLSSRRAKGRIF